MLKDNFQQVFESTETINVFYHLFAINDALDRFNRTYQKIVTYGLINKIDNLYVNIVGEKQQEVLDNIQDLYKIKCNLGTNSKNESETLNLMRDFCIKNPVGYSLYLHSKGVVRQNDPHITMKEGLQDWIDCMEYFLIERYQSCLDILKEQFTTCGINYIDANTVGINLGKDHYSGNFWWVNNKYLSTTRPCTDGYMCCELEFLFSGINHKPYELHRSRIQWPRWFYERYKREEYEIH